MMLIASILVFLLIAVIFAWLGTHLWARPKEKSVMLASSYVIASNTPLVCDSLSRNNLPCLVPPIRVFFERCNNAAIDRVRIRYGFCCGAERAVD